MRTLFAVVFASVCAVSATGQSIKPFNLYLGGGISVPSSEFADQYSTGFHVSVSVGFNFLPMMQFAPKIEYHAFQIDEDYWLERFQMANPTINEVDGGTFNAMMVGADLRFRPFAPFAPVKPFVFGGGGWANLSVTDFSLFTEGEFLPLGTDSDNRFYWNVGAGVEFGGAATISFFVQARYVNINTDEVDFNFVPVSLGIRF